MTEHNFMKKKRDAKTIVLGVVAHTLMLKQQKQAAFCEF